MEKKKLTKRERRLIRDQRISEIRALERTTRKRKFYDPFRTSTISHAARLNRNVLVDGSRPGRSIVKSPSQLNFQTASSETIQFLQSIRAELLEGRTHNVLIDISNLENISPASAVVLLAEITRCTLYANGQKRVHGNYPKTDRAKQVLTDIGFFKAFQVKAPAYVLGEESRVYVKTLSGNKSDGRYTRPVLSLFEKVCGLGIVPSKRLYAALIECMDNVRGHAYPEMPGTRADLLGEWWLCAFADPVNDQLALVFYDLGDGIPTTIKNKRSVRLRAYLGFSDTKILRRAITVGLSSKDSTRRGTGLPSLKEFVDFAPGGFLRVLSGTGDVRYVGATKRIESRDLALPLTGSLIVWTIRGAGAEADIECEGDLNWPAGPVQLNFKYE